MSDSALASRVKAARRAVGDSGREQAADPHRPRPRLPVPRPRARSQPGGEARAPRRRSATWSGGRRSWSGWAALYDLAGQGRRQVVFVTGEAGIGKTTLVEAFAGEVGRERAGLVARGQCLEQRGAPEPYLPVFDALGRLCQVDPGAVALLSRVAPTWLAQMPALVEPADRADLEQRALGGTRGRMLREAAEALEAAGSDRPLVLVLEDLHWADPSTVDLLEWLARRDTPARLLVVGTYRPADALAGGAPIGDAGAELRLRGLANELRLGELGPQAVAAVLGRGLPGADVPEELARLVHRRTDGVPLFVVQLAQAWTDAGVLRPASGRWELAPRPPGDDPEVPDDLRRLLELQLERLDAADLAMLEAAAVGGVEFAAATAAADGPGTVDAAEERCAALARHGRFLRPTGPVAWPDGTVSSGFRFAHDLHRTVLYDRIPAGRRARLHAAVAGRLERAYGPAAAAHAAELATHFLEGRDHAQGRGVPPGRRRAGAGSQRPPRGHPAPGGAAGGAAAAPRWPGAGPGGAGRPAVAGTGADRHPRVRLPRGGGGLHPGPRALRRPRPAARAAAWCCTAWPPWPSSAAATTAPRRCSPGSSGSAWASWPWRPMSCWPAPPSTRGRPPGRSGTPSGAWPCSTRAATTPSTPPTWRRIGEHPAVCCH